MGMGCTLKTWTIFFSSSFLVYSEKALETDNGLFFLPEIVCYFLLVALRVISFLNKGP